MKIKNLKTIGIIYSVFAVISVLLFDIDKISTFPIITGIMLFMLYFVGQAFLNLINKEESNLIEFGILWAIAIIFSFQMIFLISDSLKTLSLLVTLIISLSLLFYAFRTKTKNELATFIALLTMTTGLYSAYF
ncbi:hypothetical protein [Algoriphagus marinus]|uniref:hypothetical protein n=1 Tax=Algoriphagus marinus TaxID=1925762 RepID=UPI00094B9793|nr:hypothetical protein [Algoriphagus marinus]